MTTASTQKVYTPGPWQRVGWKPCGIYGPGDLGDAKRICLIDSRDEHDANARLIAAAPGLLDGCNALLGLIQLVCGRDDMPQAIREALTTSHRVTEAKAAIAKATPSPSEALEG